MTASIASEAPVAARERLLDAALALFARHGFDGASTREVALAAGVQQGLVGYHFRSKDGLWRAVVDAGFARLGAAVAARGPIGAVEPRLRLRLQLEGALAAAATEPRLMRLLCHAALDDDTRLAWLVEQHLRPLHEALHVALARLPAGGVALAALDRQLVGWLAAQVAFAPLFGDGHPLSDAAARGALSAHLAAWLGDAETAQGAWSLAAARRRALQRGEAAR